MTGDAAQPVSFVVEGLTIDWTDQDVESINWGLNHQTDDLSGRLQRIEPLKFMATSNNDDFRLIRGV